MNTHIRAHGTRIALALAGAVLAGCGSSEAPIARGEARATPGAPEIKVLSNRADMISGGDALVEIVLPDPGSAAGTRVTLGNQDISSAFALRGNGRYMGLVSSLPLGASTLQAHFPGGGGQQITVTNHPIGGPVFSGPQIQPWTCFEGAEDAQCNRVATVEWLYKPSSGGALAAYDPQNPPGDVAQTTTDQGNTVPFIVRHEIGAINRDQYRIAVLWDPAQPWEPWAPQPGFNHKLVIFHGASCDTAYIQADAPDVLNETALGRGFATMSHALNNAGHNCNIVTQAEAMLMTKEYLIERLGEVRYTIGSGCSGGSLVQQQVANAFPGLYQGITPQCSFADAWSSAMQYEDYHLIREYFEDPTRWAPGVAWEAASMAAINGHPNPGNPATFTTVIPDSGEPTRDCPGVPPEDVYDENSNPGGVRCTFVDYMVNIFGRRADGFAQIPWDNTGVQYGLRGLMSGTLTPAQFVDINSKIGGRDIDHDWTPERAPADLGALRAVYRSGAVNMANHLDQVAIIDLRGPDPGAFHDVYRTYVVRARLEREHGTAANQILWRGSVPLLGDASFVDDSIIAIDAWLAAVEADTRDVPLAQKILEDRPASVTDRCTDGASGTDVPAEYCDAVVESYTSPRIEAGMPFTDDVMKCSRKPLLASDYYPVFFTDEQWAQLEAAFPDGVCDYSVPGIEQQGAVPWMTYDGAVGGRPMGEAPRSRPIGG